MIKTVPENGRLKACLIIIMRSRVPSCWFPEFNQLRMTNAHASGKFSLFLDRS